MRVARDRGQAAVARALQQRLALLRATGVQHLLDQIVAKGVHHQGASFGQDFIEHELQTRRRLVADQALQVAAAVLLFCHAQNLHDIAGSRELSHAAQAQHRQSCGNAIAAHGQNTA